MSFGIHFGLLVRRYREAQGLSSSELAEAALGDKAKRSRISEIENGKVNAPHAKTIDALVGYLAIPLEEVDACRKTAEPSTPPLPSDTGLSTELLENLAQRFGIENPDQRPDQLAGFLKEKAKDYKVMQARLAELVTEDARMENTILAANAALDAGDFDEADDRLADAEEIQQESKTLVEVQKQASLRIERGNAALLNGKTEQAFGHFKKAAAYFEAFDADVACGMRGELGIQLRIHDLRYGSDGLVWSANLLKLNLSHWTRESAPKHWANTQNSLAITLRNQGARTGGEEGTKLLNDAVTAYKNALKIYTQSDHPVQWAMTQNNLANALSEQGTRTDGEEGTKLLKDAVTAYKNALKIYTLTDQPVDWAMTQNNLANALEEQGKRTGGEEDTTLLNDAVTAYKNALKIRTRSDHPVDWAMTQNNLAIALEEQGTRTGGEEGTKLLKDAVTAYKNALKIRTKNEHPVDWAMMQNNLGGALQRQGERTGGEEGTKLLNDAVTAYKNALKIYTRSEHPVDWAMTQNNLANALQEQGKRTGGEEGTRLLNDAVAAYKNALKIYTRSEHPVQWAMTQENLAEAYKALAEHQPARSKEHLEEALACVDRALEVFDPDNMPYDFGTAAELRAHILAKLEALG